jgi:hypothetical protein
MEEMSEGIFVESLDEGDSAVCVQLEPGTKTIDPFIALSEFSRYGVAAEFGLVLEHERGDAVLRPLQLVFDGNGRTIQLEPNPRRGPLILLTVGRGVTLILRNIILKGFPANGQPLVKVNGGTLIVEKGAAITDNGKGVAVGDPTFPGGGSLAMSGGSISGNGGCGVEVGNKGSFVMSGGSIRGNRSGGESGGGGGAHIHSGGRFILEGGEIRGNTAWGFEHSGNGGGVYVCCGGVFRMTGGAIGGNRANGDVGSWGKGGPAYGGGVYVAGARALSKNAEGVVVEDRGPSFVKSGGIIYGEDAEGGEGNSTAIGFEWEPGNRQGAAVYVHTEPARKQEGTAGRAEDLDSDRDEGWERIEDK